MNEELPEGWLEARLPEIFEINPRKPPANALPPCAPVSFIPMPAVNAESGRIEIRETRPFEAVRAGYTAFAEEDVILAKITPCFENGKAAIARGLTNGLGFGSSEFHVFRPTGAVLPEYLFHFVRQASFRAAGKESMTGTAGQGRVPFSYLAETRLPVPPLPEQRRIVEIVEALLIHLQAAGNRFGRVPVILKRFRQSVLAAACSGRLTEPWRTAHSGATPFVPRHSAGQCGVCARLMSWASDEEDWPTSWVAAPIGCLVDVATGATPLRKRRDYYEHGTVPWVKSAAVNADRITHVEEFITETALRETNAKLFPPGTLLIAMYGEGATRGKVAELAVPAATNQALAALIFDDRTDALRPFLKLVLKSLYSENREASAGGVQPNLSLGMIRAIRVPLPPIREQQEIVRQVEALFSLADTIERRAAAASIRVDALTRSILGRAFRGELVLTEAELARAEGRDYESAEVMLARIQGESAATAKPPRGQREVAVRAKERI